ncbi:Protein fmp52, mitochondrial [Eutypa lata]|nr:Protein fmp52, mitochondrial [Eutypa lata]
MASTAVLFGSTGLLGQHLLSTLLAVDTYQAVHTISRRPPKTESPKLSAQIETDTSKWATALSTISPTPSIVVSALGTTKFQAGTIADQWKIDHDLNIELAKAARAAGVKTYLFVSSAGTRGLLGGYAPYSRMKQGVEEAIKDMGFEQTIVMRPGAILGKREVDHPGGPLLNTAIRSLGWIYQGWQDGLGQDAEVIGRAVVHAMILAQEGKAPDKYWLLGQADVVRLGRDEWKS